MEVRPLHTRVWHNALEIVTDVIWVGNSETHYVCVVRDHADAQISCSGLADPPPHHLGLSRGF